MTTPAPGPYYETVTEMMAAIESGEITRVTVMLDGDTVYATADNGSGEAHVVFEQPLTEQLTASLYALGMKPGVLRG